MITTRLDERLKERLDAFVARARVPQQDVVEMALVAWLEDAEDLMLIEERMAEGDFVDWEDAKQSLGL